MNEVELLEEPITEAKGDITDVADKVEFADAPDETELLGSDHTCRGRSCSDRSRGSGRTGPGRSHSG